MISRFHSKLHGASELSFQRQEKRLLQMLLEKALHRTSVRLKQDLGYPGSHTVMLVPRRLQCAKQAIEASMGRYMSAVFQRTDSSASRRDCEKDAPGVRIRLATVMVPESNWA